jgi:hypothetical protein
MGTHRVTSRAGVDSGRLRRAREDAGADHRRDVGWAAGLPTVALVLGAAVTAGIRRDPTAWVSMAVGATIGTLALAVIVAGGISALAWMLSHPG